NLFPGNWFWTANVLFALLLALAVRRAPWYRLKDGEQLNVWLGACVFLMVLWSIKTGLRPGLNFHLLGVTALTLMMGPELAFLGVAIVLAGVTLFGGAGWQSFSLNALCMGLVPVAVSYTIYRLADRYLPKNFFVYVFVNAFFASALSIAAAGLVSSGLMWLSGAYRGTYLAEQYLPYFILMAWSEAMMGGMAMSMMVAYRPQWVSTFDDALYIRNK
ncbi:MAG: energy-coupling factor ABC transporter permease, partial [Sulfuricellaceae bacterium]|nr:energy-coupling factor ABC transporter permease [Sulfuricellaceae bacterium]